MHKERVTDDIFVFTCERYIDVNAGVIFTGGGAIVVDTLPFPNETQQMRRFAQQSPAGVKYVIDTNYHGDHTYGAYLFPEAALVSHRLTHAYLAEVGEQNLARAKQQSAELLDVKVRLPSILAEGQLSLRIGERTVTLYHLPSSSPDTTIVYVEEEQIVFSSDLLMPVPYIVESNLDAYHKSLHALREMPIETVIQGHGPVLLRGEIEDAIDHVGRYIDCVTEQVREKIALGWDDNAVLGLPIEKCGISRIELDGRASSLHQANVYALLRRYRAAQAPS